jgi:prepilin-type N-terminal cleavage/methylation domain-containing protein
VDRACRGMGLRHGGDKLELSAQGAMRMQGLFGYFSKNLKGRKGQSGFTLIELLVVVTILGVLAAIVTLSLVGITQNAEKQACEQEYKTVQAALDSYMAYFNLSSVADNTATGTNNMGVSPDGVHPLYNAAGTPTFVRNSPTVYTYKWDSSGRIIAPILQSPGGPSVPAGCVVSG